MHAILTKRIEIPWNRLGKAVAGFLSLPSWAFIIASILFWSQIGKDDFMLYFWIAAGICWLSNSVAFLLLIRLRDDSDATKSARFWFLCSALPIALVPLLVGVNFIYGILYVASHLGGMHDSL